MSEPPASIQPVSDGAPGTPTLNTGAATPSTPSGTVENIPQMGPLLGTFTEGDIVKVTVKVKTYDKDALKAMHMLDDYASVILLRFDGKVDEPPYGTMPPTDVAITGEGQELTFYVVGHGQAILKAYWRNPKTEDTAITSRPAGLIGHVIFNKPDSGQAGSG